MATIKLQEAFDLARVHHRSGKLREAENLYRQIIQQQPGHADALQLLGVIAAQATQYDKALELIRQSLWLNPNSADAQNNLGITLKDMGLIDEAIAAFRQALQLKPDMRSAYSNLLLDLHYDARFPPALIAHETQRWNARFAEPLKKLIQRPANDQNPDRRLRIGYVSPDFRAHSVARFLLPLIANHDRENFEIFAYARLAAPDQTTEAFRSHIGGWRTTAGASDADVANLIRTDQIDILVDVAGHTAKNRLLVFAQKPAPIQVTYLGYPDTTGLSAIDYRLTDGNADPIGRPEQYSSEQLIRLAPSAWCFQAPADVPVTPRQEGPITFGCFNAFAKVTEPMMKLWAQVLRAVPRSRLILKSAALGSESVIKRVQQIFAQSGIDPKRLDLLGSEPDYAAHLALYSRMDIALDTHPYHGVTTTCEALWMGVPVITLADQTHVSRVGVSLLKNVGLPELIATKPEDYITWAAALAGDAPRLAKLRSTLRQRMEASPLMDAKGFARNVEIAYRQMWRQWCSKSSSAGV